MKTCKYHVIKSRSEHDKRKPSLNHSSRILVIKNMKKPRQKKSDIRKYIAYDCRTWLNIQFILTILNTR